jgi:rhamnosyltransferase
MAYDTPRVSIVLRTKNEQARLRGTLESIFAQDYVDGFEVVVVDSGSTDNTLNILRAYQVRLIEIPCQQFSYGRALNVGIEAGYGSLSVLVSAHATPGDRRWLKYLTAPFESELIAGVHGRQIPWPDCNPLARRDLGGQFGLERKSSRDDASFSSANCAIRKAIWAAIPYDESMPGVEDRAWAKRVQQLGYCIAYEPQATVFHSHNETCAQMFRRSRREWYGRSQIDPVFYHTPRFRFVQSFQRDVLEDFEYVRMHQESKRWLYRSLGYRCAQYIGFFVASLQIRRSGVRP